MKEETERRERNEIKRKESGEGIKRKGDRGERRNERRRIGCIQIDGQIDRLTRQQSN